MISMNQFLKKLYICFLTAVFVVPSFGQTSNAPQYKYIFTVAKDGTGDFKFIQDAIDAMRVFPLAPITLYIKNGVYDEKIELPANNTDVTFVGESVEQTIITFNDFSGRGKLNTFNSFTAKISGNRFVAENITFVNAAGPVGQAVALYVDADRAVFKNCRFIGNQDTIYAAGEYARQLFVDCYIEGTTDFIFGPSTAVFQRCNIRAKSNSYIAAANTPQGKKFGFVFIDCRITADSMVSKVYLGRPWRAFSKTVFLRCELPWQIAPEGWHNWDNPENERTLLYAEYKNYGKGADNIHRVKWATELSDAEAREYTAENIFNNQNDFIPQDSKWYKESGSKKFEWQNSKK
jgi:pectinesterase